MARSHSNIDLVLEEIAKLQKRWTLRVSAMTQQGRGSWANGVLFGIEIARNRIADDRPKSLSDWDHLLAQWEIVRQRTQDGTGPAVKGIDFGIGLVIQRIENTVRRKAERKHPGSTNGPTPKGESEKRSA